MSRSPRAPASACRTSPHGGRSSTRGCASGRNGPHSWRERRGRCRGGADREGRGPASCSARRAPIAAASSRASRASHEIFDHTAAGYEKEIVAKTGGRGVDLVIEMLANVNLVRDLELIAKHGRIIVVGNRGALELNPRADHGERCRRQRHHELERVAGRAGHRARRDCGGHGAIRMEAAGRQGNAAGRRATRARGGHEAGRVRENCFDTGGS